MKNHKDLSVIIPITERKRKSSITELHFSYLSELKKLDKKFELIYVVDGDFPGELSELYSMRERGEKFKIIKLSRWFGESTAIMVGYENTTGDLILILPAYQQIKETELSKIFKKLKQNDMVVCRRWPRFDNILNKLQSRVFHKILKILTGSDFKDLGCGIRLFKRKILDEISIYGDNHRFLPLFAVRHGFKVVEVKVEQSKADYFKRVYSPGIFVRRILDILSVFFLTKFTKKPLRFFGLLGLFILTLGTLLSLYLFIQRFFLDIALADRPIVLVSLLLIVLGIQIFAIGLIGEIIIFTHARELKEYTVEEIIN